MIIESCTSCYSSNSHYYETHEWNRLGELQQINPQQTRQEERLHQELLAFRPDPDRLIDILV